MRKRTKEGFLAQFFMPDAYGAYMRVCRSTEESSIFHTECFNSAIDSVSITLFNPADRWLTLRIDGNRFLHGSEVVVLKDTGGKATVMAISGRETLVQRNHWSLWQRVYLPSNEMQRLWAEVTIVWKCPPKHQRGYFNNRRGDCSAKGVISSCRNGVYFLIVLYGHLSCLFVFLMAWNMSLHDTVLNIWLANLSLHSWQWRCWCLCWCLCLCLCWCLWYRWHQWRRWRSVEASSLVYLNVVVWAFVCRISLLSLPSSQRDWRSMCMCINAGMTRFETEMNTCSA